MAARPSKWESDVESEIDEYTFQEEERLVGIPWENVLDLQQIPCRIVATVARGKSDYNKPDRPLIDLINEAQEVDPFVRNEEWNTGAHSSKAEGWTYTDLLRYQGKAYVPKDEALRQEILKINHDDPLSSHFGATKTLELLRRYYLWDTMIPDVKEYVKTCKICQRTKFARHLSYGQLASLPQPSMTWAEISMDFITDLPPSVDGTPTTLRDSILVIVDRYTKMSLYIC